MMYISKTTVHFGLAFDLSPKSSCGTKLTEPRHRLVEVDVTTVNKDLNVSGEVADADPRRLPVAKALQSCR
eukprot:jgi/Botrbrau1/13278/Bobra.27_2s0001.1